MRKKESKATIAMLFGIPLVILLMIPGKPMYDSLMLNREMQQYDREIASAGSKTVYYSHTTLTQPYEQIRLDSPYELPDQKFVEDVVVQYVNERQKFGEKTEDILSNSPAVYLLYKQKKLSAVMMRFNHDLLFEGAYFWQYVPGQAPQLIEGAQECRSALGIKKKGAFLSLKGNEMCESFITEKFGQSAANLLYSDLTIVLNYQKMPWDKPFPVEYPFITRIGGQSYSAFVYVCGPRPLS